MGWPLLQRNVDHWRVISGIYPKEALASVLDESTESAFFGRLVGWLGDQLMDWPPLQRNVDHLMVISGPRILPGVCPNEALASVLDELSESLVFGRMVGSLVVWLS